ncbi:MAG: hypothetical protein K5930_04475 [Treponemataceae bacterium]|nr:hypothetical protein [Treponemataceae bacterium]
MKMNKLAFVLVATICVFSFFSCDMLTSPFMAETLKGFTPEAGSVTDLDTTSIVQALSNVEATAVSKELIESLGAEERQEEVASLDAGTKNVILGATMTAVLPVETILSSASTVISTFNNGNNGNAGDVGDNEMDQLSDIIGNVVSQVEHVDTTATETILKQMVTSNGESLGLTYNEDDELVVDDTVQNVLFATLSVAVSACKSSENMITLTQEVTGDDGVTRTQPSEDLMEVINNLIQYFSDESHLQELQTAQGSENAAQQVLEGLAEDGVVDPAGKAALSTAFQTVKWLFDKNVSMDSLVSILSGN